MSTNFPNSIQSLFDPQDVTPLTGHADLHTDTNDTVEALQTKVGVNGSSDVNSLDYKVAQLETAPPAHDHDDMYYTETEVNNLLTGKSATTHTHSYASDTHNHDTSYASTGHTHSYAAVSHTHSYAATNHGHTNMITGKRGNGSYYVDGNGYATITHGLGSTPVAAFVQTRAQITTGAGGGETVISLPITNVTSTGVTFRAYEADAGNNNNSGNVSTIYDTSPGDTFVNVSWLVLA